MKNKGLNISLVVSKFYPDLVESLKFGVVDELKINRLKPVYTLEVPGSCELPLASYQLFQKKSDAVIAMGVLIKGETDHYHSCCRMLEAGCLQVQMQFKKPLVLGVLMVNNKNQALVRLGKKKHIGRKAVSTALDMLDIEKQLL